MSTYDVQFERIGRNHAVPPLRTEAADADALAHVIFGYARRFLGSRDYTVLVDLEKGDVSIEAGRFGQGTVTEVSA